MLKTLGRQVAVVRDTGFQHKLNASIMLAAVGLDCHKIEQDLYCKFIPEF
jgi:hypothetical protein